MSRRSKVLNPAESYTFSKYFEMPFAIEDILADLNCQIAWQPLTLRHYGKPLDRLASLTEQIEDGIRYIGLSSEQARREFLIAPIVREVCRQTGQRARVEYPVVVNSWLKGSFDYYFHASNFLIIEAKRENLDNGLTQLATELIALDQWIDSEVTLLYGAITTGTDWRFATFDRLQHCITTDLKLYRVPEELEILVRILLGILTRSDNTFQVPERPD